jgi:prevent-host-death family protein
MVGGPTIDLGNCPMPRTIAQRELRNDNAKVIDAVAAGESFVVTRNGVPVAELRPIQQTRRTFVPAPEIRVLAAAGLRIDQERFTADLDRIVDQGCRCKTRLD